MRSSRWGMRSTSPGGCFGVTQERTCSQSDEAHEMGKAQMKVGAEERRPWDSSCDPITS